MGCGLFKIFGKKKKRGAKVHGEEVKGVSAIQVEGHDAAYGTVQPRSIDPLKLHGVVESRVRGNAMNRTDKKVRDVYRLGSTLGSGGFAVVRLATDRVSGEQYACKIMSLPPPGVKVAETENSREDIFREIEILCGLKHKNIVMLQEFFVEETNVYLIFELLKGGELLDAVLERGQYSEADARLCFVQILEGIAYLHSQGVAHRDLKLENLLLVTKDDITNIKIADFGLAKATPTNGQMTTVVGTPQYVAPEVIRGVPGATYSNAVDMWSAGVVLFILLGGYPPFYSENEPTMFEQIRNGQFDFDDPVWDSVSTDAKTLITQLLVVDPQSRLSAKQALRHPWILGEVSSAPLGATQDKLRDTYRDKWQRAYRLVKAVRAWKGLSTVSEDTGTELSVAGLSGAGSIGTPQQASPPFGTKVDQF